jgi:hypothetical protein
VKLLLDECVTRHLKREFATHEVHTVEEAGFKGLENGNLLRAASGRYDVLITVDRNLPHQQNLTGLETAGLKGVGHDKVTRDHSDPKRIETDLLSFATKNKN